MLLYKIICLPVIFACVSLEICTSQETDFVVIDSSFAHSMMDQCSRWTPAIEGAWNPSRSEIMTVEKRLGDIVTLKADSRCILGASIAHPGEFRRQYVGIVVDGRRLIYLNAFPNGSILSKVDWRKEPYKVCDGGEYYWGVLFDPRFKKFFQLATNGIG